MRRLELLEAAVSAVEIGGPGRETAAGQAAALLDGLHAFLRSLANDVTPQGVLPGSLLSCQCPSSQVAYMIHWLLLALVQ